MFLLYYLMMELYIKGGGDFTRYLSSEIVIKGKQTKRISLLRVNIIKILIKNISHKEPKNKSTALVFDTNIRHLNAVTIDNSKEFNIDNLFSKENINGITVEKLMYRNETFDSDKPSVYTYVYDSKGKVYYLDTLNTFSLSQRISKNLLEKIIDKYLVYDYRL